MNPLNLSNLSNLSDPGTPRRFFAIVALLSVATLAGGGAELTLIDAVKAGNFPAVYYIKLPAWQDGHAGYSDQLVEQVSAITGVKPPRFTAPAFLVKALVGGVELLSRIRGTSPPVTRDVLQILGRYAWYDTAKAHHELGWEPRPLQQTLTDTVAWLREQK